jgi:hypothetical protein
VTYHGVESCGLDRGDVAGHGSFCAPCGRTTATANCRSGSGLIHSARPSARAAICAFRPKTLASGPTPLSGRRPIGHQVRFSPLGVPESLKSSEHRFLLIVRHLIDHAHIGAYSVLGLPQPRSRIATAAAIFAFHWAARGQAGDGCPAGSRGCSMERKSCLAPKRCRQCVQWIGSAAGY